MKLENLRSPLFVMVGMILTLLFTIKHGVIVYMAITGTPIDFSTWEGIANIIYVGLMIMSLEVGILILAFHGKKVSAIVFATVVVIINLYFYYIDIGLPQVSPLPDTLGEDPTNNIEASFMTSREVFREYLKYIPALLLSILPGYFIYAFSECLVEDLAEMAHKNRLNTKVQKLEHQVQNVHQQVVSAHEETDEKQLQMELLVQEAAEKLNNSLSRSTLYKRRQKVREKLSKNELSNEEKVKAGLDLDIINHALNGHENGKRDL